MAQHPLRLFLARTDRGERGLVAGVAVEADGDASAATSMST